MNLQPGTLLLLLLRNARTHQRRAGMVEVLTKRQGHTQSRKLLESECSSVFPMVQRCRAAPRGHRTQEEGGAVESRKHWMVQSRRGQDGTRQCRRKSDRMGSRRDS